MQKYIQTDLLWANEKLGKTSYTVGRWGCTTCSVCMIHSKFYPVNPLSPLGACRSFVYNPRGEILWAKTTFPGMKFIWRGYKPDWNKIKEYSKDKNKGVILEVNKNHWVAVDMWATRPRIFDPWDGKIYWGIPKKYYVTGYALFEKPNLIVPEWASKDWELAAKMGIAPKDPFKSIMMDSQMQAILGTESKETSIPAYQAIHALLKFARRFI